MPRESQAAKRERLCNIIAELHQTYPDAHCELNYRNPLQLMVATILSAQCTDKQVNIVTKDLFKKYKKAADFAAVPLEELQNDIRRIGLFRNKGKSIPNGLKTFPEPGQGTEVRRSVVDNSSIERGEFLLGGGHDNNLIYGFTDFFDDLADQGFSEPR